MQRQLKCERKLLPTLSLLLRLHLFLGQRLALCSRSSIFNIVVFQSMVSLCRFVYLFVCPLFFSSCLFGFHSFHNFFLCVFFSMCVLQCKYYAGAFGNFFLAIGVALLFEELPFEVRLRTGNSRDSVPLSAGSLPATPSASFKMPKKKKTEIRQVPYFMIFVSCLVQFCLALSLTVCKNFSSFLLRNTF